MNDFEKAVNITLKFEGGLSDIAEDRGGLTKYGISQKSYPGLNIKDLTLEKAKDIYNRDFWLPCHCNELLWPVNLCVFDLAVNSGPRFAIVTLQTATGFKAQEVDGKWGPKTLMATTLMNRIELAKKILAIRTDRYFQIVDMNTNQRKFLKGWLNRVNELYFIIGQAHEQMDNNKNRLP